MKQVKLVIVEDDLIISLSLKSILEKNDYEVLKCCCSGAEIIDFLQCNSPDIIIIDVNLSGEFAGIETVKQIRKKYAIPVIYLSQYSGKETIEKAKYTQPYGYILKPIKADDLCSSIEMVLYKHRTEQKLKESEQRLNDIIQFLPLATFAVNGRGEIIAWNKAIENLTKTNACDMVGKGDYEYSIPFYGYRRPMLLNYVKADVDEIMDRYKYDDINKSGDSLFGEFELTLNNMKEVYLWGKAGPLYDSNGNISGAIEILRDISEEKKVRKELKSSEMKFYKAFMASPQLIAIVNRVSGNIIEVNDSFCAGFETERHKILHKQINDLNIVIDSAFINELKKKLGKNKSVRDFEINFQVYDSVKHCLLSVETILLENMECFIVIMEDITELRELQKEISTIVEEERFRIGRDLHDDLGQLLTGASFMLEALKNDLGRKSPVLLKDVAYIGELVSEAVSKTRNIARMLSPVDMNEENGFETAIEQMVDQIRNVFFITLNFSKTGKIVITDQHKAVNLYYIAREATVNAVKHSNAEEINIDLVMYGNILKMMIEDNGTGFDEGKIKKGMGLKTMKYRAGLIGAKFTIDTNDLRSRITVTVSI